MPVYFISAHQGAQDWARQQGIKAKLIPHLKIATISPGDIVMGSLPVHLAAQVCACGARYFHLSMDLPQSARHKDLTAQEMRKFGARLEEYFVKGVPENE